MNWGEVLRWPIANMRALLWVVGGCAMFTAGFAFMSPNVDPILPAELAPQSPNDDPALVGDSLDFIFRPLFMASRSPPDPVIVEEAPPDSDEPQQEAAGTLDDLELLGVFSSGSNAGIILLNDGQRQRLYAGQALRGWTLKTVDARAALFEDGLGGNARVELAVASSLQLPTVSGVDEAPSVSGSPTVPEPAVGPVIRRLGGAPNSQSDGSSSGPVSLISFSSIAAEQRAAKKSESKEQGQ